MLDILAFQHLAGVAEFDFGALRTGTGNSCNLVNREFPLSQNCHHFAPDIARRADDCHPVTHFAFSSFR